MIFFFFSSRRRHTRSLCDWSSDVCSSDLLSEELRARFRASGLYHLLAVSGQNVALIVGGVLMLAYWIGLSRMVGEVIALSAIAGYVLAVGWQPSVVRAGVAGALASLAW